MNVSPIEWKYFNPVEPKEFPCMVCKNGDTCKMATHIVTVNGCHLVVCKDCAKRSERELTRYILTGEIS